MPTCDKYIGKKVIITRKGCNNYGQIGWLRAYPVRDYTHAIMSLDGKACLMYVSDKSIHKEWSWKPVKLKIG